MDGKHGSTVRKSGNGENPSASRIPQQELKYWAMMLLSLFWFIFLTYILLKANNRPSVSQWWKTQSQLEQSAKSAPVPTSAHSSRKLPFPQEGDYYKLNFDVLADFPAGTPDMDPRIDPRLRAKMVKVDVPDKVQALNGQKISVVGFMIPMDLDKNGGVSSFILAQSRMTCCYGVTPKLNQWIYVTMAPGTTTSQLMDIPITVYGTLGVGTHFDIQDLGWCLYRMTSDKVDMPKNSWF